MLWSKGLRQRVACVWNKLLEVSQCSMLPRNCGALKADYTMSQTIDQI